MLCRGCSGILVVLVAAILGLGLGVLDCVVSGTITKPLKSINNNKQEPVSAAADRPLESSRVSRLPADRLTAKWRKSSTTNNLLRITN